MNRRAFLDRLAALAGSTAAATALLPILQNDYAQAQTVARERPAITPRRSTSPASRAEGLSGQAEGCPGKLPAVIVIHENRGLNPHIKDVTRRMATEGFLALGARLISRPWAARPPTRTRAAR